MMDQIVGYVVSAFIGVSLGLIGGGGSIITVPMLVYLFHISPTVATTYSLFIVGSTALVGGIQGLIEETVDWRKVVVFAIPSTAAVYVMRHNILEHIPEQIITIQSFSITKNFAVMVIFSIVMLLAAVRMIRSHEEMLVRREQNNYLLIVVLGVVVGLITGFVGAGGGFLIIPALVLFAGLPMKRAIGTSLMVIAINSLIGFFGDMSVIREEVHISLMMILSVLAIGGIFLGHWLSNFVRGSRLKAGFGWFTLSMALFILIKEVLM